MAAVGGGAEKSVGCVKRFGEDPGILFFIYFFAQINQKGLHQQDRRRGWGRVEDGEEVEEGEGGGRRAKNGIPE